MMNLLPKIDKGSSSSMDQEFIPPEIIINILSRLPAKTVIRCKCVCKSWLELLETPEFAKDHLSKSAPGLVGYHDIFKIFEFVDEVELELEHHSFHYNLVMEFGKTAFSSTPPHDAMGIEGSANGLVLLSGNYHPNVLYVCNPITREYIELPCLDPYENSNHVTYGFGVSVMSGQYKVVRFLQECAFDEYNELLIISKSECWVYTLGTGTWRSIAHCSFYDYDGRMTHAFFNGNLHWLVKDLNVYSYLISCLDLETEVFSTFSPPPSLGRPSFWSEPVVFDDCLCMCDNTTESDNEIVIWLMKEYGNERSWTKQFVITKHPDLASQSHVCSYPLKLFKDGDILLLGAPLFLFYYSKKTNTAQELDLLEHHEDLEARLHVSSLVSLRSFAMETVRKF